MCTLLVFSPKKIHNIYNVQGTIVLCTNNNSTHKNIEWTNVPLLSSHSPIAAQHTLSTHGTTSQSSKRTTPSTRSAWRSTLDAMHLSPRCERYEFIPFPFFSRTIRPASFCRSASQISRVSTSLPPDGVHSFVAVAEYDGIPLCQPHFFHNLHHVLVL